MSMLPVSSTSCSGSELDARLAQLASMEATRKKERSRAKRGAMLLFGSLLVGALLLAILSGPFREASLGLFALGMLLIFFRTTLGRWSRVGRWVLLTFSVLAIALGVLGDLLPAPGVALAALDVRAFPLEALTASALALMGVGGALVWDAAAPPYRTGPMNAALVRYAGELARPLLYDAAVDTRGLFRLSPFEPGYDHWKTSRQGELEVRTLERLVCEVHVPLEGGEQVVVEVKERIATRTRYRRNARGKLKAKPKGYVRTIEANLRWWLATMAPNRADLTAHLLAHLQSARVTTHGLELRARGEPQAIDVHVRRALRGPLMNGWNEPSWIEPSVVHESARFIASVRAMLAPPPRTQPGAPLR